ncbi:MAG: HEAT repeat domain-containing protein, partial [Planctomycetota bacterium]|nr:HEAT repeat domain-containing protein [Planctomycetota bacterium]
CQDGPVKSLPAAALLALLPIQVGQLGQVGQVGQVGQDPGLATGAWRAWLDSPGGELPFGIELVASADGGLGAFLVNGEERIPVTRVTRSGGEVTIEIEHYDSRIVAAVTDDGRRLDGTWTRRSGPDSWSKLPFHAAAGKGPRFAPFGDEMAGGRIDGLWEVDFESSAEPALAIFAEGPGDTVRGTFLTTVGDYRYLAGTFQGDRLKLSCFDGAHAFLFDARLRDDGTLAGDFWSRDTWHETWTAKKSDKASMPDAFELTEWTERASIAELVFPDVDGNPRALTEPGLLGQATLLQIFGTWCPNCYDETTYLVELHERYRGRGLAIVGLAFELTGDFERDAEQVRRYVERHGIEYPILIAGTADKGAATAAFPALDRVRSYPTTIFLHADGRVRAVHTGFSGPATGAAHAELRGEFESLIEELLAETPQPDTKLADWLIDGEWFDHGSIHGGAGGDYTFSRDAHGNLSAHHRVFGSGVPVISEEDLPVRLVGDAVWIGDECWRADLQAMVLTYPRSFQERLAPREHPAPLWPMIGSWDTDGVWYESALARREAIVGLTKEREPSSKSELPEILPLLRDESIEVRVAAAWAAGRVHEKRALEALVENLAHPNAALRRESVVALDRMGVHEPLKALTGDSDPLVRAVVERALTPR